MLEDNEIGHKKFFVKNVHYNLIVDYNNLFVVQEYKWQFQIKKKNSLVNK